MATEYISREAAIEIICGQCAFKDACDAGVEPRCSYYIRISQSPAAVVRPVVRGEWIETGYFDQAYQPIYECSHCHGEVADSFVAKHLFCLHCGADMRPEGRAKE